MGIVYHVVWVTVIVDVVGSIGEDMLEDILYPESDKIIPAVMICSGAN